MVLTAALALWLGHVTVRARQQRDSVRRLAALEADVFYSHDFRPDYITMVANLNTIYDARSGRAWDHLDVEPRTPRWLREAIGEDYFRTVVAVSFANRTRTSIPEECCRDMSMLDSIEFLNLDGVAHLTNEELACLGRMAHLERLYLARTDLSDGGLVNIGRLSHLKYLGLGETAVTDEGLVHLEGLARLEMLELADTQITDAGVDHLQQLKALKYLYLSGTKVTKEGAERLRATLPGCGVWLGSEPYL